MTNKFVSVIIPNYNSIKFIQETLNSVFNQTYPYIEVVVIDDGSTDGSLEYLQKLKVNNLILKRNKGKGACAARNYGLRLATGHYIQFLDADDVLDLEKINSQIKLLEKHPKRVAVCNTKHFYEETSSGIISDPSFLYSTDDPIEFLLNLYGANNNVHSMVAQHAWLTPKCIIDKAGYWDEGLIKDQDGEYFCRVLMASSGICYDRNTLCYYRKHKVSGSVSSGKSELHLLSQLKALQSKSNQLELVKNTKSYKNAMALQYKIIAIDAYPQYKTIYKKAIEQVKCLGGSGYQPILGGKIIETVKFIFGWRVAKYLSYYVHLNIKGAK